MNKMPKKQLKEANIWTHILRVTVSHKEAMVEFMAVGGGSSCSLQRGTPESRENTI